MGFGCLWVTENALISFIVTAEVALCTSFAGSGSLKFSILHIWQVSTQMIGSFGYSAPEFALSGVYTVKSDVYSFGVVMLELLTGRKPLDR